MLIFRLWLNWEGISLGWTATIWLTHILSQADHRLNQVQDWVAKHIQTISGIDFIDYSSIGLWRWSSRFDFTRIDIKMNRGREYEIEQGKHLIRVYDLSSDYGVRLDALRWVTFENQPSTSIFQLGLSFDHRIDTAQVKIMLASLDPLGWTEATQVVEGNEADDLVSEPAIKQVRRYRYTD